VGSVTEIADNAPGENATMLSDSGNISFSDVDLIDTHTVSVTPQAGGYLGTLGAVVSNPSTGDGSGTLTWTFMVADADVDYLAAGQTLTQYYDVSVNDGHGGVATETVEITITGTNDAPIIGTADLVGGVTEIGDGQPGENATLLSDSGNISFGDVDLIDTHTVSVTPQAGGYLGTLGAVVTDPSTGDGSGTVQWTFSVQDSAVDYLAAGETLTQYYDVSVNDGHGGIATETVTITITGTNDAPTAVGDVGTMDAVTYTFSWDYSLNAGNDYSNDNVTITAINGNSVDGSGPTMGVDGYPQNDSGQMLDPGEGIQFVFDDPVKLVRVDFGNFNVHDTATWEVWNGNTFVASGVYTNSGNPNDSIFDYEFGTEFDTIKITNTDASNSFSIDEVLVSNQGSQSFVEGTPLYFAEADLLYNDFDPDTADTLNITGLDSDGDMQSTSAFGATVTLDAEGNVLYDPSSIDWENPTWNPGDSDTFNYTVSDGNGGFDTGTVTVNVNYVDSGTAFDGNTLLVDDYLLSGEQSINFDNLALLADNVTHIDLKDGDEGKALATLTADNVSDLLGDTYTTLHIDGESVDSVNLSNDFTFDQALSDGATGYDAYTGTASGGEEVIVYIDTDITDVNIIP
jgi:VCBS repeat-containing protein